MTKQPRVETLERGWQMLADTAHGKLSLLNEAHQEAAQVLLEEIERLAKRKPRLIAKGRYKSRLPGQPKKAIEWDQPDVR